MFSNLGDILRAAGISDRKFSVSRTDLKEKRDYSMLYKFWSDNWAQVRASAESDGIDIAELSKKGVQLT